MSDDFSMGGGSGNSFQDIFDRGNSFLNASNFNAAINEYTQAIGMQEHSVLYYNRGFAYQNSSLFAKATADYDKALQLGFEQDNPTMMGAFYYNRGVSFGALGNNDKATADLKRAADRGVQEAVDLLASVGIQYRLGSSSSGSAGSSTAPAQAKKKGPLYWLMYALFSLAMGFGYIIFVRWGYFQIFDKDPGIGMTILALLIFGIGLGLFSLLFFRKKPALYYVFGCIISIVGWLVFVNVIPKQFDWQHFPSQVTAIVSSISSRFTNKEAELPTSSIIQDVNFRDAPGTNSNIIRALTAGEAVTVTGEAQDGWLPIEHNGESGWVSSEFVE
jgi:hypothetical protein